MERMESSPMLCKQGVAGSIPATSTNMTRKFNQLLIRSLLGFHTLGPITSFSTPLTARRCSVGIACR
jgi:hypothetical protein